MRCCAQYIITHEKKNRRGLDTKPQTHRDVTTQPIWMYVTITHQVPSCSCLNHLGNLSGVVSHALLDLADAQIRALVRSFFILFSVLLVFLSLQRLYSRRNMRIDFDNHGSGADLVCELNELNRLEGNSSPTPLDDDGGCSHQNDGTAFTSALDGLTRQNSELQAELAESRQAANELAGFREEVRPLQRGSQTTGVGVDTRLLGKPSDFSGAQDAW